ncbi:hypothetical protein SAMN05216218_13013 [Halorientalis regularis]|uniref:Uncharacterized protein n=1 Tax=Halorientalis regularis TaxID=660518 RepID=A0A1G7TUX8_9EURY|nr:hypothetical protein SAMN05216218_13013 [Halorientalis regularis]
MPRERITVECGECGTEKETDPIHDGEIRRVTSCANIDCDNWIVVHNEKH